MSRSTLTLLVKLGVSGALLLYILLLVDAREIVAALSQADPGWVVVAFSLYLGGQALSSFKWRVLARAVGYDQSAIAFLRFYFVGMFFNVFGLGTVGGDVVRVVYLSRDRGRRTLAANTVIADRGSGLLVVLAIALVALLAFRNYDLPGILYWTTLGLSAGLLVGWRAAPALFPVFLREDHWLRRLFERDLAPYWTDLGLMARVGGLSAVFHLSQIATLMLLAEALGLDVPWTYFFIFGPLVNAFSALPVSWNGLGIREGGYVYFLTHVGVSRESAVAFALLWFGLVLASGFVGGVVYLRERSAAKG